METKEMNIYQKLLHISNDIKPIAKDMEVGQGRNSYKAVGEAQVKNEVKPYEFKYGVYSYPHQIEIVKQETIVTESTYNGKTEEKTKFFVRALITFRFVNTDKPEEFIDMQTFGDGVDSLDKSAGKAMTYALKYGLINAYKMISGEDPDQFHSSENEIKTTYEKPQQTKKPSADYQPPSEEEMKKQGIEKGRAILQSILDKTEHKPMVLQKFLKNHNWDSMKDVTFKDNTEFKKLQQEIKDLIQVEKDIAEVGI